MRGTSAGSVQRTVPATRTGGGVEDGGGVGRVHFGRRSHGPMLTIAVIVGRTGVDTCQVRPTRAARHTSARAEQHRADRVGEVVVGDALPDHAEQANSHAATSTHRRAPHSQHDHPQHHHRTVVWPLG